jgi:hypothetical protein
MKPGPGKVLPGPCTMVEEARAAIETIERQYPAEAGLIQRMADRLAVFERIFTEIQEAQWEMERAFSEAWGQVS